MNHSIQTHAGQQGLPGGGQQGLPGGEQPWEQDGHLDDGQLDGADYGEEGYGEDEYDQGLGDYGEEEDGQEGYDPYDPAGAMPNEYDEDPNDPHGSAHGADHMMAGMGEPDPGGLMEEDPNNPGLHTQPQDFNPNDANGPPEGAHYRNAAEFGIQGH
jgi:hypothetical protein